MNASEQVLEIRLDDGRVVVARPRPEDQPLLEQLGTETTVALASSEFDTAGHGIGDEIEVDVAGHAMTLRLPTAADAESLRRLLVVSAASATIVAAGAIAALQSAPAPRVDVVTQPFRAPAPAQDFQQRRDVAIDEMLEAPPAVTAADDLTIERGVHGTPLAQASGSAAASNVAPALRPGSPSADFGERREQATDELLEAPPGARPGSADGAGSQRVGGPQD